MSVNKAEEFVYQICRKSFLSIWSYANPKGKGKKELCDILVVCDPNVVIFSVKEIGLSDIGNIYTDWARWQKRAIEDFCKQIYGAERWINDAKNVIRNDGTNGLAFPAIPNKRIHRVAVALGSEGQVPMQFGNFGKGFVHVFDATSFHIILHELDTISDFVQYLTDKEDLYNSGIMTLFEGTEEDLLALYLYRGRIFPTEKYLINVGRTLWSQFVSEKQYKAKKRADKVSYIWDNFIEILCEDILLGNLEIGESLTESETALRIMAHEDRFSRRLLGSALWSFLEQKQTRARMTKSLSNILYIFLATYDEDKKYVAAELLARCFVARGLDQQTKTIIGINVERSNLKPGFALKLVYFFKEEWTAEDKRQQEFFQTELGYFSNPKQSILHDDEYPSE